jgi:hypothetical protein
MTSISILFNVIVLDRALLIPMYSASEEDINLEIVLITGLPFRKIIWPFYSSVLLIACLRRATVAFN